MEFNYYKCTNTACWLAKYFILMIYRTTFVVTGIILNVLFHLSHFLFIHIFHKTVTHLSIIFSGSTNISHNLPVSSSLPPCFPLSLLPSLSPILFICMHVVCKHLSVSQSFYLPSLHLRLSLPYLLNWGAVFMPPAWLLFWNFCLLFIHFVSPVFCISHLI